MYLLTDRPECCMQNCVMLLLLVQKSCSSSCFTSCVLCAATLSTTEHLLDASLISFVTLADISIAEIICLQPRTFRRTSGSIILDLLYTRLKARAVAPTNDLVNPIQRVPSRVVPLLRRCRSRIGMQSAGSWPFATERSVRGLRAAMIMVACLGRRGGVRS